MKQELDNFFPFQEPTAALILEDGGVFWGKGIGAKTAERIIVDLRDKVEKFGVSAENISAFADNKVKEESLSALEVLGIPKKMSEKIADRILKQNPDLQTEELVKQILKMI